MHINTAASPPPSPPPPQPADAKVAAIIQQCDTLHTMLEAALTPAAAPTQGSEVPATPAGVEAAVPIREDSGDSSVRSGSSYSCPGGVDSLRSQSMTSLLAYHMKQHVRGGGGGTMRSRM